MSQKGLSQNGYEIICVLCMSVTCRGSLENESPEYTKAWGAQLPATHALNDPYGELPVDIITANSSKLLKLAQHSGMANGK